MKPAPIMEEEEIEEEEEEEEMEDQEQTKKKERLAANAETIRSDCGEEESVGTRRRDRRAEERS